MLGKNPETAQCNRIAQPWPQSHRDSLNAARGTGLAEQDNPIAYGPAPKPEPLRASCERRRFSFHQPTARLSHGRTNGSLLRRHAHGRID